MAFIVAPIALNSSAYARVSARHTRRPYWHTQVRHGVARMSVESNSTSDFNFRPDATKELSAAVTDLKSRLKRCTVYFVGPMGSGKSVIAKFLSKQLSFRFLDTDTLVEKVAKKPITEIFAEKGEAAFRDLEAAVLDQVQAFLSCCVATGGGIVMRDTNWGRLQTGIVVFLDVPVDVLVKRLKGDTTRPLLQGADLTDRLTKIMEERRSMYELADVTVNVADTDAVDNVALEVCRKLSNFIKENPPRLAKLYSANLSQQGGAGKQE